MRSFFFLLNRMRRCSRLLRKSPCVQERHIPQKRRRILVILLQKQRETILRPCFRYDSFFQRFRGASKKMHPTYFRSRHHRGKNSRRQKICKSPTYAFPVAGRNKSKPWDVTKESQDHRIRGKKKRAERASSFPFILVPAPFTSHPTFIFFSTPLLSFLSFIPICSRFGFKFFVKIRRNVQNEPLKAREAATADSSFQTYDRDRWMPLFGGKELSRAIITILQFCVLRVWFL